MLPVEKPRDLSLDLIKVIAMALVIAIHSNVARCAGFVYWAIYHAFVVAIPLFFAVSGAILIPRKHISTSDIFKRVGRIIRLIIFFSFLYWIVFWVVRRFVNFDFYGWLHALLVIGSRGERIDFLWFLEALAIMYLFLPALNRLWHKHPATYLYVLAALVCIDLVVFIMNVFFIFEIHIPQQLRLWNWFTYFMLGPILLNIKPRGRRRLSLLILGALILLATHLFCVRINPFIQGDGYCEFFYPSPVSILFVSAIFILCRAIPLGQGRVVRWLSPALLPVYLLHIPVMALLRNIVDPLSPFLHWISILLITVLISKAVLLLPHCRRLFRI
ncbi:MAG: acyltransferase family protein [Muribaculaceae bacterium]|nr:acyltransferase family protein [Muribaculaceae bacterium]